MTGHEPSPAGGETCGRYSWFCVYTKPQAEEAAAAALINAGFPVWFPRHQPIRTDREIRVEPIFPRYLFAQPRDAGEWVPALYMRGVTSIIRNPMGQPTAVPASVIASLQAQADPDGIIRPPAPRTLTAGDRARVTAGALTEFAGLCTKAARDRVWLLLTIMGRTTEVSFPREQVEAV